MEPIAAASTQATSSLLLLFPRFDQDLYSARSYSHSPAQFRGFRSPTKAG